MINKILITLILLFLPVSSFAAGEKTAVSFLSAAEIAKHKSTISWLEGYLSSMTTIVSEFTQVSPNGGLATGKFYLQRPGKMRWEYNPPTPILMVSNGGDLVYYDSELEQVTHIPVGSTLISFLAQKKIRFNDEKGENAVGITSFEEAAGVVRVGVAQREKPSEGNIVLEFFDSPLSLRKMVVTDASGNVTNVALNNAKFGEKIEQKLFEFDDPREKRRR